MMHNINGNNKINNIIKNNIDVYTDTEIVWYRI